jgi:HPt (histidine-containing phosphotransfer) domain-containing protein
MKIAALITVAALTCGTALAQGYGSSSGSSTTHNQSAATANDSSSKGDGILDKTKRAFHRLGEKLHASGNKAGNNSDKTAEQNPETAAMGAGPDKSGSSRKSRMDQAYSDSKKSKSSMDK